MQQSASTPATWQIGRRLCLTVFVAWSLCSPLVAKDVHVRSTAELATASENTDAGSTIILAPGVYELAAPLVLKAGVAIQGAGIDKTTITHAKSWAANPATLPDPETHAQTFDRTGYLIHCANDAHGISISHLTLTGPKLHGAIFGWLNHDLQFHHLELRDFMYCGIRTYGMKHVKIHDCTFIDVGMRWDNGQPGLKGGITGGAIFGIWMGDTEIWNNRFVGNGDEPHEHYYGVKGREARRCRIHHNTIEVGFSIELPFEGDEDVEIDHNILKYAVSIPKYAGGHVPESGRTFHIHHNWLKDSYSIEFVRNGVEIDHNLFDFSTAQDGGNLISAFGDVAAPGPAKFHNNLVSNPGRGVMWMNEPYARLEVRNNHILARTTATPRTEGLFGFNDKSEFATFAFKDNIIECQGTPRPLFRNDASGQSIVENNQLTGITDLDRYTNAQVNRPAGLEAPLRFQCGVNGEITVEGWQATKTSPQQ